MDDLGVPLFLETPIFHQPGKHGNSYNFLGNWIAGFRVKVEKGFRQLMEKNPAPLGMPQKVLILVFQTNIWGILSGA